MKVWLKLLIGTVLGIIIGFILPSSTALSNNLAWLGELAIRIGRYVLVPILVFSLSISVYELRQDGRLWGLILKTIPVILLCSAFVIGAGILAAIIFPPGRIPILSIQQAEAISLNTQDNIMNLFPSNMFASLAGDGVYLLPVCIFAFFMGIGFSYDRNYTKPVISLFDSLSRIFYHITTIFSEVLGILMIILGAYWAVRYNAILEADVYSDLLTLLVVMSILLGCGILPLFLYLLGPRVNPWKVLYGCINQGLTGFFSGDINFTLPVLLRSVKENLGVRRRANTITVTLFAFFGRAGSAMVAAVSLMVIINSYSSLDIGMGNIISIGTSALLISFLLPATPGNGAYTALAVLCIGYGQGFEAGYLILRPIAFYLIAIGTFLDVMITSIASYGISHVSGFQEDNDIKSFI